MRKLLLFLMILRLSPLMSMAGTHDPGIVPLDFSSSIAKILSRSPDIAESKLNLEVYRAKNLPNRLRFLPNVSLSATMPLSNNFLTNPQSVSINSNLNLFRWGADYFGLLASISGEESQRFAVAAKILIAEQEAVNALISEIQRVKEVDIYIEIVRNQAELLKIAQKRYQRGFLPLQEVEKLNVELANAKASLADGQIRETETRAKLENLLGSSHIKIEWPWVEDLKKGRGQALAKEEFRISQRPDWIAVQKNVESQADTLSQNWRLLLPSVDAQISYGNYSGFFGSFTGWAGMVSVSIPLFDQLTNYSKAKAQANLKAMGENEMEKVQRDAKSQWQASQLKFQVAIETALVREETLKLSRKLYEDNFKRFQAGRVTANDLTIDRARMNSAELFAVQGWAVVHITFADLCHSLGYRISNCTSN